MIQEQICDVVADQFGLVVVVKEDGLFRSKISKFPFVQPSLNIVPFCA